MAKTEKATRKAASKKTQAEKAQKKKSARAGASGIAASNVSKTSETASTHAAQIVAHEVQTSNGSSGEAQGVALMDQGAALMDDEKRAKVFAALSDPTRVRLAGLLACRSERSGTDLAGELGVSLALFCHHSSKMAEAGLITRRKEGQTTYYALNRNALSQSVAPLLCDSPHAPSDEKAVP